MTNGWSERFSAEYFVCEAFSEYDITDDTETRAAIWQCPDGRDEMQIGSFTYHHKDKLTAVIAHDREGKSLGEFSSWLGAFAAVVADYEIYRS